MRKIRDKMVLYNKKTLSGEQLKRKNLSFNHYTKQDSGNGFELNKGKTFRKGDLNIMILREILDIIRDIIFRVYMLIEQKRNNTNNKLTIDFSESSRKSLFI